MSDIISENNSKAVILYYFSSSELLSHGKNAIKKISDTLDIFLSSADKISVIWYHNPGLDDYLKSDSPEIWKAYLELEKRFADSAIGILEKDCSKEDQLVDKCSAYYGSGGYLATSCSNAGKPVMIQDISSRSSLADNQ